MIDRTITGFSIRIGKGCAGGGMASVEDGSCDPSLEPRQRMLVCRLALGSCTLGPVSLVAVQTA
jgi:hypothetical protein